MRHSLLITACLAAIALPAAALAQGYDPSCDQANQSNRAAGTIIGAIGGAVVGNAVAGRHNKGEGTVVGGLGGAVVGNAIAGGNNRPCGYADPAPSPQYGSPQPMAYGQDRFWQGAPQGIHERIAVLQDRINRSANWLGPREVDSANRDLDHARNEDARLRAQDGGRLSPQDRDYMQSLLDNVGQRLHWLEHNG
jgi:hypothetical protein